MTKHSTERRAVAALETIAGTTNPARRTDRPSKAEERERDGLGLWFHRKFLISNSRAATAGAFRRSKPIHAYVGPNGGGKSACMVYDTLPSLRAGRKVLSTVRLTDPDTGQPFPSFELFTDWNQLLDLRDADVLMDEMVGIASSRESQRMDSRVQNLLVQLRRRNIVLRWTAPNWARADKIIREVTQAVTECRGYYPSKVNGGTDSSTGVLWRPKRLLEFKTYDTIEFEEWSAGKREKSPHEAHEYVYGPGSEMFRAYDTLDAVSMVAGMTPEGTCDICEGTIRRHTCKGHTDSERERMNADRRASQTEVLGALTV